MTVWAHCLARMGDVWQALGRPANLVVLDFSVMPARQRVVHFRPWLAEGFAGGGDGEPPEIDHVALARMRHLDAGLIVVRGAGDDDEPAARLTQGRSVLGRDRACLLEVDGHGRLLIDGSAVREGMAPWTVWRKGLTIEVRGANAERVMGATLPLAFAIDTVGADETLSLLTVSVSGLASHTFHCPPGARGVVEISAQPGLDHDVLSAVWRQAGSERRLLTVEFPTEPARQSAPLSHLAVVLDRTCPDNEHWYLAYALARGLRAATPASAWDKPPDALPPSELNSGIREGLLTALASALESGKVEQVALWWSADRPNDRLANFIPGNEPPPRDYDGGGATRDIGACRAFFASAGYTSGLDLFDPIDKALAGAADELPDAPRCAVLVVGNSPPPPPASGIDRESPLDALSSPAWLARRVRSTNRHGFGAWEATVARCRNAGAPVHYLFLSHREFRTATQREQSNYQATQRRVEAALKATVSTTIRLATKAEVESGVGHAIELLMAEHDQPSRVRVSRLDNGRRGWLEG